MMCSCSSNTLQIETGSLSRRPGLIIIMTPVVFKVSNRYTLLSLTIARALMNPSERLHGWSLPGKHELVQITVTMRPQNLKKVWGLKDQTNATDFEHSGTLEMIYILLLYHIDRFAPDLWGSSVMHTLPMSLHQKEKGIQGCLRAHPHAPWRGSHSFFIFYPTTARPGKVPSEAFNPRKEDTWTPEVSGFPLLETVPQLMKCDSAKRDLIFKLNSPPPQFYPITPN